MNETISKEIGNKISRGTTGLFSKGMYTNEEKMTIMCIVSRREVIRVKKMANNIDPHSFIVISNVREVYGKGFKRP